MEIPRPDPSHAPGPGTGTAAAPADRPAAARPVPGRADLAIVVPAYNAAAFLPTTLPPILRTAAGAEVVVVDPGSDDGTPEVAECLGARVLRLGRRAGPAEARNAGVAATDARVLLFVDSDCVVHEDTVDRVRRAFAADPALVSLTGSYDDTPPDPGFFSQYMNLRHHWTHQHAKVEGATFWAGCGAVRADAFREAGGFDAVRFPRPMIEDIELGLRLAPLGRTCLDPALHVTHLKRWTLASVVTTDVFHRAVPWSHLVLAHGRMPDDLNLRRSQRIAALLALPALLCAAAIPAAAVFAPAWTVALAAVVAVSVLLNRGMLGFFLRRRGIAFAAGAWAFHQVHLFYSGVTFALVAASRALGGGREAPR